VTQDEAASTLLILSLCSVYSVYSVHLVHLVLESTPTDDIPKLAIAMLAMRSALRNATLQPCVFPQSVPACSEGDTS
jgi:hypothetical protein